MKETEKGCQEEILLQALSCPQGLMMTALRESASQRFKQRASAVLLWAGKRTPLLRPQFAKLLSLTGVLCCQDPELGRGCRAPA